MVAVFSLDVSFLYIAIAALLSGSLLLFHWVVGLWWRDTSGQNKGKERRTNVSWEEGQRRKLQMK